jgi:hypothetical protein
MTGSSAPAHCAGPGCTRPLARAATGRPGPVLLPPLPPGRLPRTHPPGRSRAGPRRAAGRRQGRGGRLWRPLEQCGFHDVADLAAAVVAYAGDPTETRASLTELLRRFQAAADQLARLALGYRDATDTAARLAPGRN